jgi:Uma2 family endonuclease
MEAVVKKQMSAGEYLEAERRAETKSEFLDGEVFVMSGGTHYHSLIAANLIAEVHGRLKGKPCQPLNGDMRLNVEATGLFAYPDVQVACPPLRFLDACRDTLLNPRVIIEVLSDSTAAWDRGTKFWHYRHLDSLTDYVLVSQQAWLVEHYRRQEHGAWLLETLDTANSVLNLNSVTCEIALTEIYAGAEVNLNPAVKNQKPRINTNEHE